jgi:transposase
MFEDFIQKMLVGMSNNPEYEGKNIILYLDNARIHSHSMVLETARRMKVNVLFSAPYSPWLNPIESLFGYLKNRTKEETVNSK